MNWVIEFHEDFEPEFDALVEEVQDQLLAHTSLLETFGSKLGRPYVDTLNGVALSPSTSSGYHLPKGSQYSNMKELRFKAAGGVWRAAFAFDPKRQAILLVAGDKSDSSSSRFYKQLIQKADTRFSKHLSRLK